jgi:DNA-binding CsgD family transcriptional regulator
MYDTSSRFLSQLCADRRASLVRSGEASADHPFTRALRAAGTRLRPGISNQGHGPRATESRPLTGREHEIVMLVAEGLTNAQIAERLWISPGTVRRHLENVFAKLDVHTRTAAVARIRDRGTPSH